ncbi:MAG: hypothetical protein WC292_02205 [Clostridia bacterium]
MKVILSKKRFDTSYGGYPSIIDGKDLISMPIPESSEVFQYSDLKTESGASFFDVVSPYYSSIFM